MGPIMSQENVEAPVDKHGFTIRPEMTDLEAIVRCLKNTPAGICPKQAKRLVEGFEAGQIRLDSLL